MFINLVPIISFMTEKEEIRQLIKEARESIKETDVLISKTKELFFL